MAPQHANPRVVRSRAPGPPAREPERNRGWDPAQSPWRAEHWLLSLSWALRDEDDSHSLLLGLGF